MFMLQLRLGVRNVQGKEAGRSSKVRDGTEEEADFEAVGPEIPP